MREPPPDDNPFHRHSNLLAAASALVIATAAGLLTRWRLELLAVPLLAFAVSFVLFSRLLYRRTAVTTRDSEPAPTDLVGDGPHAQYDIDETGYQLSRAYEKLQEGDPSLLERLAEQEALEERQRHPPKRP